MQIESMRYGRLRFADRRYHLRQLEKIHMELEEADDLLRLAVEELKQDIEKASTIARFDLARAQRLVGEARGAVEFARARVKGL